MKRGWLKETWDKENVKNKLLLVLLLFVCFLRVTDGVFLFVN